MPAHIRPAGLPMTGDLPAFLERADPRQRSFPASWRDAAIRFSRDPAFGGVRCPGCARVFTRPAELRRLHGDHIVPYSRGGLTVWANLQLLCANCNLKKNAKLLLPQDRQSLESLPGA